MSRKLVKLSFAILLLVGMVLGFAVKDSVLANTSPDEANAKIESLLLDKFTIDGSADFIVTFTEKADLSAASTMDWDARGHYVYDKLTLTAQRSQAPAIAIVKSLGLEYKSFFASNTLFIANGSLNVANAVAALPGTASIRASKLYHIDPVLDFPNSLVTVQQSNASAGIQAIMDWGITDTKADQFWSTFGMKGDSIVVANIDTGVQWDHPALVNQFKCDGAPTDPACWYDPTGVCTNGACDNNGHGTHTMGTMVGSDDPALTYQVGMAPDAQWIACKGCATNSCSDVDLNGCADWLLAPDGDPNNRPNVVNNSWGGGQGDDWYRENIQAWVAAGIFPAFSIGNSGPSCGSANTPGDNPEAFGSAAHDVSRDIADFSSRGPGLFEDDPYIKPNLSAPGVSICSSVPGNGWNCGFSGTSMASPHTAGAVALLWSCNPGLIGNIDQTFQILQDTADTPPAGSCGAPEDGEGNYTYGYGYLNTLAMGTLWCGDIGTIEGHVTVQGSGVPIVGAEVHGENQGEPGSFTVQTDSTGYYHTQALAGTYDVSAAKYGYLPAADTAEIVIDQTTVLNFVLTPAPSSVVDGTVTDASTGWPLYARIDIDGYADSPVWTDPETGYYSVSLANGLAYTFHVTAWSGGYSQEDRTLPVLATPRTEDFALSVDVGACSALGYEPAATYINDFEADNGGFSVDPGSVNSSWTWGSPTSGPGSAHSGTKVWATNLSGNYPDYSDDYLVSPIIDLSALAGGFQLDWWQWLQTESCCDYAYIQVSKDGGATWSTVNQAQGNVDLAWAEHSVSLDNSYAVANFKFRFYLHTDLSVTFPGWYIDDVAILGACLPQDGGLVVGNVYDQNTDLPLNDALVSADTGATAETEATPDDPNVDDGFYTIFVENEAVELLVTIPAAPNYQAALVANPGITLVSPAPQKLAAPQVSAHPDAVLWDQPLSTVNQNSYVDQEFPDYPTFSSFLADDFVNEEAWSISTIFVPGDGWNGFTTLMNATALTWQIFADNNGIPAGNPYGGNPPVWTLTLLPSSPQVVISNGSSGYPSNTTLNLASPVVLPPGRYWLVFYPTMNFTGSGQYGRQPADSTNGYIGQFINPGGGFGNGTAWQSWTIVTAPSTDIAFRLEGEIAEAEHNLTATHDKYAPDTQTVSVPDWGTVAQDFYLGAGILSFTPPNIHATLDMGESTTVEGTLSNDGSGAATFEFKEQDRGYEQLLKIHIPEFTGELPASTEPTSIGHAPSTGTPSAVQAISPNVAEILGTQAYAVDVYPGYNLVTFDTDTPGTWTIIA
ncbi:MAG: hypothetical protein FIA98_13925, partial [Anaerolineae bacterium]|nr:hypothetical protein [Anaerolineae bacterium]